MNPKMGFAEYLATLISTVTITSCCFQKVPQIQQTRKARNAEGLYMQPMIMEILSYTTTGLYNYSSGYALLTYMEYPIIVVQVYVLMYYLLKYKNKLHNPMVILCIVTYFSVVIGFFTQLLPLDLLGFLLPFCTPLSGFAKMGYIYSIIMDSNADSVSLVTWVISVATNLSRIFTTYMDSNDVKLITNLSVSAFLSTCVLITAMVYQCKPDPPPKYDPTDLPRIARRKSTHRD